jgi:hypothetical protein
MRPAEVLQCSLSTQNGRDRYRPVADIRKRCQAFEMKETIAHQAMRDELLVWLSGAISDDTELEGLCDFLQDDFPYDAEHVVGLVLRQHELKPWQDSMAATEPLSTGVGEVRECATALLEAMRS